MYEPEIEYRARKYAQETVVNPEKVEAFTAGAVWAITRLCELMDVHPMEDQARMTGFLDGLRLKDVKKHISELTRYRPKEEPRP